VCCKAELGLAPSALPAGRVIKPQVINQAVGLPASGSLYYFNYLDSAAYPPSELLGGHLFPSGLLNAQAPAALAAHPKLFLLENAKLAGLAADKFPHPAPYPHKERLPAPLEQVLKENSALTAERGGVKGHSKLPGGSTDGKPKNFTCEVCGKVRPRVLRAGRGDQRGLLPWGSVEHPFFRLRNSPIAVYSNWIPSWASVSWSVKWDWRCQWPRSIGVCSRLESTFTKGPSF
jgi:hypothetical protein